MGRKGHGESNSTPGSSMATLCELTRWKDPVLSGLVAGSGLLFLIALSCYSLIAVAAYFGLSFVLLGLGSKLYVHLMGLLKKPCKDPQRQAGRTCAEAADCCCRQGGVGNIAKSKNSCQKLERVKSLSLDLNPDPSLNLDLPKVL